MGVAAEHLPVEALDVVFEALGETAGLAEPVFGLLRRAGRSDGGVGGEDAVVVDFAHDPFLHEGDVLVRGDADGIALAVEPGVGEPVDGLVRDKGGGLEWMVGVLGGAHRGAGLRVAEGEMCAGVDFLDHLDHAFQEAVLFDD